jgi:CSLREA domain-containing protein
MASKVTYSRAASRLLALGTLLAALMAAFVMLAASQAHATTTFYVNSTADYADANVFAPSCDTGNLVPGTTDSMEAECTLRAAIQQANHTTGADTINFVIPGSGVHTIAPQSALPKITGPVSINGYSQPGAHPNTKAVGNDAVLKIELSGASSVEPAMGLRLDTANSAVKGLAINRWSYFGIFIDGTGATGNYIGTYASDTQDLGNGIIGDAPDNTVGGTKAGARNVISGNQDYGRGVVLTCVLGQEKTVESASAPLSIERTGAPRVFLVHLMVG